MSGSGHTEARSRMILIYVSSHTGNWELSRTTEGFIKPYLACAKRVCSVGVFFPSYGFKDVAQAVERLRDRTGEDIGLILLDGGFVRDESYRTEVLRDRDWITVLEK